MILQKRVPKRAAAFLKGVLEGETSSQEVLVRDISVDGALLDVTIALRVFETITLVCGGSRINGIVAWSEKGRLGIEFAELLTNEALLACLAGRIKVSAPKGYRADLGRENGG